MRPIKPILALLFSATLLAQPAQANNTEEQIAEAEAWMKELGKQLMEQGEVSGTYLKNYMQCLRDQQALREDESDSLKQLWQQMMGATESCGPVIEEMFDALEEDNDGKRALQRELERSL